MSITFFELSTSRVPRKLNLRHRRDFDHLFFSTAEGLLLPFWRKSIYVLEVRSVISSGTRFFFLMTSWNVRTTDKRHFKRRELFSGKNDPNRTIFWEVKPRFRHKSVVKLPGPSPDPEIELKKSVLSALNFLTISSHILYEIFFEPSRGKEGTPLRPLLFFSTCFPREPRFSSAPPRPPGATPKTPSRQLALLVRSKPHCTGLELWWDFKVPAKR